MCGGGGANQNYNDFWVIYYFEGAEYYGVQKSGYKIWGAYVCANGRNIYGSFKSAKYAVIAVNEMCLIYCKICFAMIEYFFSGLWVSYGICSK